DHVFLYVPSSPPTLHSFPTRRSSDLSSRGGIASDGEHTRSDAATVPEPGGAPQRRHGRAGAPGGVRRAGRAGAGALADLGDRARSEEHTSELQSLAYLVCRLLLEKKK